MRASSERRRRSAAGAAAMLGASLGLLPGCGASAGGEVSGAAARTFVYECPGAEFVVRIEGDVARIFTADGELVLPRVRSASGVRFEQGGSLLWTKGEEAMLTVGGEAHRDCRNDRRRAVWEDARLRGVAFRAVGNEPGWYLEVGSESGEGPKLRFVGDYGGLELLLDSGPPVVEEGGSRVRYEASDGARRLGVLVEARPCRDSMSGEAFPSRVTVVLDERGLHGCGRALH